MGPAWFSSVMGTGILSNLLGRHIHAQPWLIVPSAFLLGVGALLLTFYTYSYCARWIKNTNNIRSKRRLLPAVDPNWGTVSMGYLSIGAALLTVGPHIGLSSIAVPGDTILWWIGTLIGIITNFSFMAHAIFRHLGQPVPAWGLAVVGPMVSATTGAILLTHYTSLGMQFFILTLSFLCFIIALVNGAIIFALAYGSHMRFNKLPTAVALSAWIPLGVVGQSTAAAVAIASSSGLFLTQLAHPYATHMAIGYGCIMLLTAIPVIAFAVRQTISGFARNLPFSPGWWALTFPIGTLALGGAFLSEVPMIAGTLLATIASIIGWASLTTLCFTWTFCAIASLWAVKNGPRTTN
ncbi:C4-dicarboxylate transporter/malic acid transport protein [Arcanobacterium haemolyticum]|nr:C4-dicarboxylate transporter/malic acid transport protein [Arcanobacterium haemolyticum]